LAPAVCWTIATVTLVAWHVPALFTLALHSAVWHFAEEASFFGAGLLFWWPVIGPAPLRSRLSYPARLLYVFATFRPH